MALLILLVALNILLLIIFRLFKTFKIDTFQAIVFNYITCVIVGSLVLGEFPINTASVYKPWFPFSLVLGVLFISGFNILAKTVQHFGVTLTSIAQKMSLIITVIFTIVFFRESVNAFKVLGILLAIVSIIMINLKSKENKLGPQKASKLWYLLILTFFFSGLIEAVLFFVEAKDYSSNADIGFVVVLFFMAAILGLIIMLFGWATRKILFSWKNVLAGICLGIPNFFTIHLLLVLINKGFEGSLLFPILNVSIILGSALVGFTLFKEKLTQRQWLGFIVGIFCIVLISLS